MNLRYSVGLDTACKKIDICMSVIDDTQGVCVVSSKSFLNSLKGFKEMEDQIIKNYKEKDIKLVLSMEATFVYHENCDLYFSVKDYKIFIILPNKSKNYFISLGLKSKNNSINVKGLSKWELNKVQNYSDRWVNFFMNCDNTTYKIKTYKSKKQFLIINFMNYNILFIKVNRW